MTQRGVVFAAPTGLTPVKVDVSNPGVSPQVIVPWLLAEPIGERAPTGLEFPHDAALRSFGAARFRSAVQQPPTPLPADPLSPSGALRARPPSGT